VGPLTSLAAFLAVAMALATGAIVFALMSVAARGDREAFLERQYARTEMIFRAAIDPRFQSKAEEINRVVDRLVVIEAVTGAALYDGTGHLLQTFGERPDSAFETISRAKSPILTARSADRIEFYFSPETTATPFHLVTRIPTGEMRGLEAVSAERQSLVAGATAAAAGLAAGLICFALVVLPMRRIAAVVDRVTSNPATADAAGSLKVGVSEVRLLAATLDRFRGTMSDIWRTKVAVADAILDRSPFAVVQLAADGSPTFANPAAAELFEREIVRGHATSAPQVRDLSTGAMLPLKEHLARHRGGPRLVEIVGSRSPRYAIAGSLTIGADTRSPTVVAMFADATAVQLGRLDAETRFASGTTSLRTAHRRELELKLTLESCVVLMSGPDRGDEVHLDALPFAVEWLAAAKEAGIAGETLVLNAEGPTIMGPPADVKAVMRLALLLCYARCGAAPADIVIEAKGINYETAGVTIRAQAASSTDGGHEAVVADWQLVFAALRTAMSRANGQLTEFNVTDDGTVLRFALRGAAERMATSKAS
jgi:PAS domain-containing protein